MEKDSASNDAKHTAPTAIDAARHCPRSRVRASAAVARALRAVNQPVAKHATRASSPRTPVSSSEVRYWLSTKK